VQLILKVRLSNAIQLLAQTTERISKIAYQVGFQDVNYFNKCFKKEYQISPTEYRKRANTETALEQTLD
jgi:AraC-like DNA-binding protein